MDGCSTRRGCSPAEPATPDRVAVTADLLRGEVSPYLVEIMEIGDERQRVLG